MACELTLGLCTRNRREELAINLAALARQEWDGHWEVLVVDNGSTDGTGALTRERMAGFPVPLRLVVESRAGLSFARNRAIEEAGGRAVVFLDDDATPLPGLVRIHGSAFRDEDVIGTGGRILPILPNDAPEWLVRALPTEVGGPTSRYEFGPDPREIIPGGPIPFPFGANMGVLTSVALSVGGFRTYLGWGRRMLPDEEVEFYSRLARLPGRLLYVPDAAVEHRIAPTRTSKEYDRMWHRGLGRASMLRQMPLSLPTRLARLAFYTLKYVGSSVKLAVRPGDPAAELESDRMREICVGRCLELLGR